MKTTWQKGSALLIVGVMIISTLVAFISAPVVADTIVGSSRFDVVFDDACMESELIYDTDKIDTSYFLLGEGDGIQNNQATANTLTIEIQCTNDWFANGVTNASNVNVNITNYDKSVFDFTDADPSSADIPGGTWAPGSAGFLNDPAGVTRNNYSWTFDVLKTAGLGVAADTTVSLRIWYQLAASGQTSTFNVQIYLSSLFDEPGDDAHDILPDIVDASGGDAPFEAGDVFKDSWIELWNYDDGAVNDVECVLTEPGNGVTLSGGRNTCSIPGAGAIPTMDSNNVTYRTDVAVRTAPGIYPGSADITYTRQDSNLQISELGLVVDWRVDFSFLDDDPVVDNNPYSEFQCRATSVTIVDDDLMSTRQVDVVAPFDEYEQSTYTDNKIRVNVTIENNGNTDLFNVQFGVLPDVWDAAGGFFRNPRFFYHETGTIGNDGITVTITQLNVGQTVNFTIEMIVENDIPIGEHRLPIMYDGFYFNNGELEEATGFRTISGGDGIINNPAADDLEIIFSIVVTDSAISCHATVTVPPNVDGANAKNDIRANSITVNLTNDEQYNFIDVTVRANFNNTPWYNPIINMGDPWVWAQAANPSTPQPMWAPGAGGAFDAVFWVDTDPALIPDRYPFQLEITAVIEESLQQVSIVIDYTRGCVIDFTGYGPELIITSFTADEIVPGETFTLEMEITNMGDDTARDVFVSIPSDTTEEYEWDIESDFKEQFNWSDVFSDWGGPGGGLAESGVTWSDSEFPSEMFYTMESLDVDNIREIVEINLYMDGVYSMPGSTIMIIKINDLAPGASTNCTFTMIADKDLVNGKPYTINVTITGIDPDNGTAVQIGDEYQVLEVMSSLPGSSYNPVEVDWFDTGIKALALLLFLIIIIAILLMVFNKFKGEGDDYDDEDEFGFEDDEDDYEPMGMEEPEAPAPEEPATVSPETLVEP